MKTVVYKAVAFLFGFTLVCLALFIPTGDLPTKWLYAVLYAGTGFLLLLAMLLNSQRIMKVCALFAALAFMLLWFCVAFAPKVVYGILYEYGAHVLFVTVVSSLHLGTAIFAYFAVNHMFKKEP
ncbi:MAG: hypothetical protein JNL67_09960 [Planctomycetaceae bacterium]|nr:hypothetical protein [Planctomycetaceae bacterium]